MKKQTYIAPEAVIIEAEDTEMFCSSIITINGDAGIGLGAGTVPGEAECRELGWEL